MPRLAPSLFRRAAAVSPHVRTLLPACRDIQSAANELRWIRAHVQETLALHRGPKLSGEGKEARVARLCAKRGRGVPLQYVLGSQPFGRLDIRCRPGVLVPRAETEAYVMHLADVVKASLPEMRDQVRVVDFCTGTGCIALGLYEGLARWAEAVDVTGVDVSEAAVDLSRENLRRNVDAGVLSPPSEERSITFRREDVFDDAAMRTIPPCDVLVSNPPYISRDVWTYGQGQMGYSVRKYEPKLALVPGDSTPVYEGCDHADVFYARLLDVARWLRPNILLFEVGDLEQALRVVRLVKRHELTGQAGCELWRDWPDLTPQEDEAQRLEVDGEDLVVKGSGNGTTMGIATFLQRVVKNDAMKEDPPEVYGWRVVALTCASCFGGMLFGWDSGAIGGVLAMEETQKQFGYFEASVAEKSTQDQNIVSTLQCGCLLACLVTPYLTDKYGRRWSLITTGVITIIGVILQAASAEHGTLALMFVGRFVAGLGVGAASMLTPLYVSECAPRAIRGGLTAFYQLFIVTGTMLSFWINYGSLLHLSGKALYAVPLALQAIPAVFLSTGMLLCPESPRWCAKQDHWEKTRAILVHLRGLPGDHPYIQGELDEMSEQLEAERRLVGDATAVTLLKEMWLIPGNRKRAVISFFLMMGQQMIGVNAVNYYAPQIFKNLGMSGTETSLFATGIYGVLKVVACACFLTFVADSLGRRWSLIWTGFALGLVMFIVGIYGCVSPPVEGQPIPPFGYVAITCIYIWTVVFQLGWGPCCWILVSEIPTARLRAMNVALAALTQWLFNFIIARTVLTMQLTMGYKGYGMFFMFGGFGFAMALFVYFFIPETKGLSLEKMDELFGVTQMAKDMGDESNRRVGSVHEQTAEKR
ncbi:quinate permease [Colletotrichum karsti]|uniref:Quinate permease n=1 Tax=Colletotrichum karsti TaxID=1095194 RepID=A0A9P6IED1_9PEZI|nr:quinate permease [Colletotrichum karsti]KAF9881150.1 quinate permease [Colletotrichum karsti]